MASKEEREKEGWRGISCCAALSSAGLLTLCAHQYHGYILSIAKVRHFGIVIVDGVEAALVLQAEHEDYRIHPTGKLQEETRENKSSLNINVNTKRIKEEHK